MNKIILIIGLILPVFAFADVKTISTPSILDNAQLVDSYERVPDCPTGERCSTVLEHYIKIGFELPACGSSITNVHYSLNNVFNWRTKQPTLYVTALAHANILSKVSVKTDSLGNKTTTEMPCLEKMKRLYEIKTDGFFEKENIFLNKTVTL